MALLRKPNRPKTLPIRHPWESRFKSAGNRFSLDPSSVHAKLTLYYPPMGRPSIDPVLMIRMFIIGYVFAIR
jgi:hypothetical protein